MADPHSDPALEFLDQSDATRVHLDPDGCPAPLRPVGIFAGRPNSNNHRFSLVILRSDEAPSPSVIRRAWKWWQGGKYIESVMIAIHGEEATLWGPQREDPPVWPKLKVSELQTLCEEILRQFGPDQALRFLQDALPQLGSNLAGILNQGMLSLTRWRQAANGVTTGPMRNARRRV